MSTFDYIITPSCGAPAQWEPVMSIDPITLEVLTQGPKTGSLGDWCASLAMSGQVLADLACPHH
jgi:hypothetical protein